MLGYPKLTPVTRVYDIFFIIRCILSFKTEGSMLSLCLFLLSLSYHCIQRYSVQIVSKNRTHLRHCCTYGFIYEYALPFFVRVSHSDMTINTSCVHLKNVNLKNKYLPIYHFCINISYGFFLLILLNVLKNVMFKLHK